MESLTLWHGSRYGITGDIIPKSTLDKSGRYIVHDFGPGFYAGTKLTYAVELIAKGEAYDKNACIARMEFDKEKFKDCKIHVFTRNTLTDWVLLVAYNRKYFHRRFRLANRGTVVKGIPANLYSLTTKYLEEINNSDIIVGPIADDRLIFVFDLFINGCMGIKCFTRCLLEGKIGTQYIFKTPKSCDILNKTAGIETMLFSTFMSNNNLSLIEMRKRISNKNENMRDIVARDISLFLENNKKDSTFKAVLDKKEKELSDLRRRQELSFACPGIINQQLSFCSKK